MRRLQRSPTSTMSGLSPGKMLAVLLWIIVGGMIGEMNCKSANNIPDSQSEHPAKDTTINQSVSAENPASAKTANPRTPQLTTDHGREGRAVPARTKTLQLDEDDYREFLYDEALGKVRKVPLYLLKVYSHNKSLLDRRQGHPVYSKPGGNSLGSNGKRDTVIPAPRFGRQSKDDLYPSYFSATEENKRDLSTSVIPYPRLGRDYSDAMGNHLASAEDLFKEYTESGSKVRSKRDTTEYIVPQIRYGRSMLLMTKSKGEKSTEENPTKFVLPYPRPGRSSNVLLPYPRPGRSSDYPSQELMEIFGETKRQDYMIPSARLGRSEDGQFDDNGILEVVDGFLGLKVNPLLLKNMQSNPKIGESTSSFVIPYPRPGKKSIIKTTGKSSETKNVGSSNSADYVLPYPRPGKKSYTVSSIYGDADMKDFEEKFMLPYPRPGRSTDKWFEEDAWGNIPQSDESSSIGEYFLNDQEYDDNSDSSEISNEGSVFSSRSKRSNNVVPYPRLGRSDAVIPYPRPGRSSQSVVPYPRPGRSDSVLPYPRLGRSFTVVPYPRQGRSNAVVPYPRPGRSDSVIPYPRLGKSVSIVPYPRPGRSNSLDRFSDLGNLNFDKQGQVSLNVGPKFLLPNIRPGRSEQKNGFVVPYPRPGRSSDNGHDYVVPHPRIGRSEEDSNNENETSNTVIPYPRLGRSESQTASTSGSSNSFHKLNKHMIPRVDDSIYLLPYPRPGRYSE